MLRWVQQRLQGEWQGRDWLGLIYHKLVQGAADNALVAAAKVKDQHALRSLRRLPTRNFGTECCNWC